MDQTDNVSSRETDILKQEVASLTNSLQERDRKIDLLSCQMEQLSASMQHMMNYMKMRDKQQDQINLHRENESIQINNKFMKIHVQNLVLKEGMEMKLYESRPKPFCTGIRESFYKIFYPTYYKERMKEYYDRHGLNPVGGGLVFTGGAPDALDQGPEIVHLSDNQIKDKIIDDEERAAEDLYSDYVEVEKEIENPVEEKLEDV